MDDLQIIEAIEAVRDRLQAELPDLEALLSRVTVLDYRTANPAELQECLAQVTYRLDPRLPADAREIQRKIARAEHETPAVGAAHFGRAPSWVVQENEPVNVEDLDRDSKFAQGLRFLSIPGAAEIPSRFGEELAACVGVRPALSLVKKRLPGLKGLPAYEFLAAVGYPVAVPTADAQRFCRYIGLLAPDEKSAAERYMTIIERASRLTGVPMAQVGLLLNLYAGGQKAGKFEAVCSKRPRCEACALAARCANYAAASAAAAKQPARGRPIHEWSVDERPRERFLAGERLSNSELLAIILRTGTGQLSAVELGREIMHQFGTLHDLEKASPQDIVQKLRGKGIGPAKAVEICAAIELGRRVTQPAADTRLGLRQVGSSRDVFEMCRPRYKAATQEEFLLLILNTKNRVQKEVPVSLGTLNSSIVHPRDVFRHALREAAAAVIFVHNHPSGDPSPSDEDILLTARLVDIGKLLGIQVLDHVIIGSHEWYSFADHGRLK